MKSYRGLVAALAVVVALVIVPAAAQAAIPSVYGGTIECKVQPSFGNVRLCGGFAGNPADSANSFTLTWDHETKIDVNVILPPESGGTEGPYPLIGDFHGWGGSKQGLSTVEPGTGSDLRTERPAHPALGRRRLRGLQHERPRLGSLLRQIRPVGGSRRSGLRKRLQPPDGRSLRSPRRPVPDVRARRRRGRRPDEDRRHRKLLRRRHLDRPGALRNREMLPDRRLVPWKSPDGQQMEIAAAAPQWPWTRHRLLAGPERPQPRLRHQLALQGPERQPPDRGLESELERRPELRRRSTQQLRTERPGSKHPRLAPALQSR